MNDASDILPRQLIVLFQPEPESIRDGYGTVTEPFGSDIPAFDGRVRELLDSLEAASLSGRLFVHRAANTITGVQSVIIGVDLDDGPTIVAELLGGSVNDFE